LAKYKILHQHGPIAPPSRREHQPMGRPERMKARQIDFKDASAVPAGPVGKQQHRMGLSTSPPVSSLRKNQVMLFLTSVEHSLTS
jgi:hypothetical protein